MAWFNDFETIGPAMQADAILAFSPANPVQRPLPDPGALHEFVQSGVKRPRPESTSSLGDNAGKGKAPAHKRREIAG